MNYARSCEWSYVAKGAAKGIRTPPMTRPNAGLPACALRLVPIQSRSLPAVLFSVLDGVKTLGDFALQIGEVSIGASRWRPFDDAPPHPRNKPVPIVAVARRQNQSFLGAVGVKQRVSALDSGFLLYESRIDQQTREPEFGARGRNWRQFFSGVRCLTGGRERFDEEELCL